MAGCGCFWPERGPFLVLNRSKRKTGEQPWPSPTTASTLQLTTLSLRSKSYIQYFSISAILTLNKVHVDVILLHLFVSLEVLGPRHIV